MQATDATRILLNRKHTTAKLRKQCQRARETVMRSETPIYEDDGEYFSSKPSEVTPEQRLALKLRRASMAQLIKWAKRNAVRQAACLGIAERIAVESATSALRRREKFIILAGRHEELKSASLAEISRRVDKACGK